MDVIYERCGGIDVHKAKIVVCLRNGRRKETREFGTMTHQLREMTAWLKGAGCEIVAMESTASYWKPLYNIFEMEGLPAMVVNAQHMKAIPGRKTDVKDAEWIADLLRHGLLRGSFIPDREQRELRELTRYRKSRMEERARELNRLQKMLEGANIKLGDQISDITGVSAQALLEAALGDEPLDLQGVAQVRHSRMKASAEELLQSLSGILTSLQRELIREVLRIIREQSEQIQRIEVLIERHLGEEYRAAAEALEQIPGVGRVSAQQIIAEIGVDMSRFPSAQHLCSWAGVCPGNNESAGKRKSGRTNKANKALKTTLTQCAKAAVKNKNTFFYAQYQRLVVRRGKNRATMAVAHSMLIAIYHVLQGNQFRDLGSEYYNQFNREKKINSHFKALEKLGFPVTDEMRNAA